MQLVKEMASKEPDPVVNAFVFRNVYKPDFMQVPTEVPEEGIGTLETGVRWL